MDKKIFITSPLLLFMLAGCSEPNVSCSADVVKKLVEAISFPMIKEKFIANRLNEKSMGSGTGYLITRHFGIDPRKIEGYPETKKKADEAFAHFTSELHDIRTTGDENSDSRVECTGIVSIALRPYQPISYNVAYNAQLGIDREKVYVEINTFD